MVAGIRIDSGIQIGGGISVGGDGNTPPSSNIDLNAIATALRPFLTTTSVAGGLRNPTFYEYNLDGDEYYISDGGGDMMDGANYTAPSLLNNTSYINGTSIPQPPALAYNVTTYATEDTSFDYVSLGYGGANDTPLTMLGTRTTVGDPCGFQKAGNIGADGSGDISFGAVYTGQTFNGFTTYAYYRQTFNNGDPTICDLYILLGHSSWGSVFGTVANDTNTGTQRQGTLYYVSGGGTQNVLAITSLLSDENSNEVPLADLQDIVQNYTYIISQVITPNPGVNNVFGYNQMNPPVIAGNQLEDNSATINGSTGFTINDNTKTGVAVTNLTVSNQNWINANFTTVPGTYTCTWGPGSTVASSPIVVVQTVGQFVFFIQGQTGAATYNYPFTLSV